MWWKREIGEKTTLPPHWLVDHMSPAEAGISIIACSSCFVAFVHKLPNKVCNNYEVYLLYSCCIQTEILAFLAYTNHIP
jgi:hypothetical protein